MCVKKPSLYSIQFRVKKRENTENIGKERIGKNGKKRNKKKN
jgi:hypothetical protein